MDWHKQNMISMQAVQRELQSRKHKGGSEPSPRRGKNDTEVLVPGRHDADTSKPTRPPATALKKDSNMHVQLDMRASRNKLCDCNGLGRIVKAWGD